MAFLAGSIKVRTPFDSCKKPCTSSTLFNSILKRPIRTDTNQNIRVAQMDKKCRTYWDQCFSHSFYLVLLENGQKSAGKGHLTPPFWPPFIWPIYKGNEAWKWHFLTNLKFDHPNDPKLIRKHWETLGHTQIPPPGPKEQQNWALWWNSSPLNAPQVHVYPRCK